MTGESAELRYTGFDDHVPTWEASGDVLVKPASACLGDDEVDAENEEADTDTDSETAEDEDTSEDSV